jgi:hypothetical protein
VAGGWWLVAGGSLDEAMTEEWLDQWVALRFACSCATNNWLIDIFYIYLSCLFSCLEVDTYIF